MRIGINLATRPFADLGPALKGMRIAMAVLAVVAIGLVLGLRAFHQSAEQARAHAHSLDGQIARVKQERQGYEAMMRQPENALVLGQADSLNKLFDEKAFSWTLAMEDLETVLPGGVQVTSIEPARDKDGHITLHLRVSGPRDRAIELVSNLEHSRHFAHPRIVGESSEQSGGPGERVEPVSVSSRVNFELQAEYTPPVFQATKTGVATKEHSDRRSTSAVAGGKEPATEAHRTPYTGMSRPKAPHRPSAGGTR